MGEIVIFQTRQVKRNRAEKAGTRAIAASGITRHILRAKHLA